ncbi:MAG: hypothetical protein FK734_10225 [Asgard group archaeon]|nr:hypothetical protein [Asgard group archaeon]
MDSDCTYWPHLAESYTYLNATHIRLELRSDIEWDEDPSSTFIGEQFDAEDVYFTLFCLKNLSSYQSQYQWLEDMVIIDDYTIDLFVDGDPLTPENEPDYIVLHSLTLPILPEHYLNQTQLVDGITPDITHYSWDEFDTEIFGTGLMTFDSFTEDYQTILKVKPDSWWLDPVITSDPNMDFDNRFGDIWDLLYLTIVAYSDPFIVDDYFTQGIIDYMPIDVSMVDDYNANTSLIVYNIVQNSLGEFGFNVRSSRGTPLQSTTACVGDPSTSIGLAIRKAIAYACNKTQINEEVNDGKNYINNHPIFPTLGVWLSGSITTFDCNLSQAQYYMELAGFDMDQDTDGDGLTDKDEVEIYGTDPEVADTDGDGWTDSEEIDQGTDPLDENDHPTASSPSPTTTYTFDVFTIISALFFTSLALALFVLDKQKRK